MTAEFLVVFLFGYLVYECDKATEHEKSAGSHTKDEYGIVDKPRNFNSEEASCAEDLADARHQKERERKADTHTDSVNCRVDNAVLACIHLSSAENNTVNDDK